MSFEQSTYSVSEDAGPVQPVLILSNALKIEITVQVTNTDGSATGKYCSILNNCISLSTTALISRDRQTMASWNEPENGCTVIVQENQQCNY